MALVAHLLLLLVIFAGCIVGPGLLALRRVPWLPLEKLCASIGLSCFFVYAAMFGLFMAGWQSWSYTITIAAWIATLV